MTREEFIVLLKEKRYSYEMEGDKIIITYGGSVWLSDLESIPPGVHFENGGSVGLSSLNTLPSGVNFKNRGNVWLRNLETIPPGVHFKNRGDVDLMNLETLPFGVHFENDGSVILKGLGWIDDNEGIRIEGVGNKRLVNLMISKDLFV